MDPASEAKKNGTPLVFSIKQREPLAGALRSALRHFEVCCCTHVFFYSDLCSLYPLLRQCYGNYLARQIIQFAPLVPCRARLEVRECAASVATEVYADRTIRIRTGPHSITRLTDHSCTMITELHGRH